MRGQRLVGLDVARGLVMLYIVAFIHAGFWFQAIPQSFLSLMLFEMPLIFLISGFTYGCQKQLVSLSVKDYFAYLLSRLSRILIPYFCYAFACAVLVSYLRLADLSLSGFLGVALVWLNPFTFGSDQSIGALNWHLWFMPVFLVVLALMPLIAKIFEHIGSGGLWVFLILVFLVYFVAHQDLWKSGLLQQTLVFGIFSVVGYGLAVHRELPPMRSLWVILLVGAALLVGFGFWLGDFRLLSAQRNKFPPNHLYFLFGCCWLAVFLIMMAYAQRLRVWSVAISRLSESACFRPFMRYGYSIYLWQGMGYTLVFHLAERWSTPLWLNWLCAVLMSILLAYVASPIENIRIRWQRVWAERPVNN